MNISRRWEVRYMPFSSGSRIKYELYGASHEPYVGIKITGIPAGEHIDCERLNAFMLRRVPGRASYASKRCEADTPVFLSGLENGLTTGDMLNIRIANIDVRSSDYDPIQLVPRPGHADYAVWLKSGGAENMLGGGRYSGRMTAPLCAAGGICLQILSRRGIDICAHIGAVGALSDEPFNPMGESAETLENIRTASFPTKDRAAGEKIKAYIETVMKEGDSVGGTVECIAMGFPSGHGGASFEGIEGTLAYALFSIPAVKGVEFGSGFGCAEMRGSENNDEYHVVSGKALPMTNNAGGILGGISTGLPIIFRAAFKPTPSISKPQRSVNMHTLSDTVISVSGRHDACIVPRAVPVVEAAAAIALLDILEKDNANT